MPSLTAAPAAAPAPVDVATQPGTTRPFEALMAVEGRWTGDDRVIMVEALTWEGLLPFSLTSQHDAEIDEIAGWVSEISRVPGMSPDERFIVGRGEFNLGSQAGADAVAQLEAGVPLGVSVDLDAIEEGGIDPNDPALAPADDPMWMMVVETARVRALALCVIPAFAEALITLGAVDTKTPVPAIDGPTPLPADQVPQPEVPEDIIIIASGHTITIPSLPPSEWFAEPTDVEIAGALTVTDEGRVYGLLAPANVPHAGYAERVTVPMGNVDYSRFMRGETVVAGGGRVVSGNVTMNCGHGDLSASQARAIEHYDNTCSLAATVAVGETSDRRGVWVAGALLPGVTGDQVQRIMACQLSGHWLPTGHGYELLAALLVPVPGFGMARTRASVTMRDGAMVASSVPVRFADGETGCGCGGVETTALDRVLEELAVLRASLLVLEARTAPMVAAAAAEWRQKIGG